MNKKFARVQNGTKKSGRNTRWWSIYIIFKKIVKKSRMDIFHSPRSQNSCSPCPRIAPGAVRPAFGFPTVTSASCPESSSPSFHPGWMRTIHTGVQWRPRHRTGTGQMHVAADWHPHIQGKLRLFCTWTLRKMFSTWTTPIYPAGHVEFRHWWWITLRPLKTSNNGSIKDYSKRTRLLENCRGLIPTFPRHTNYALRKNFVSIFMGSECSPVNPGLIETMG